LQKNHKKKRKNTPKITKIIINPKKKAFLAPFQKQKSKKIKKFSEKKCKNDAKTRRKIKMGEKM
jgi:hypothetical protein